MTYKNPQGWKALLETQNYSPELAGKIASQMVKWNLTLRNYHTLGQHSGGSIAGTDAWKVISDLKVALDQPANIVQLVAPESPESMGVEEPVVLTEEPKRKPKRKAKSSKET